MSKHYIAIDLGATSGRVILASVGSGKGEESSLNLETVHRFPTPLVCISGKYYWNIYSIYEEIVKGLTAVGSKGLKIESIGVDTWGVDFVAVAGDGSLCGLPRSYRDPYTEGVPDHFFNRMPREELYRRTGIQIMNFNSVFQLYAQKHEGSSALKSARRILFMPDAISYLLTGNMVCEYTILSTSALMDPRRRKIDRKVLEACGSKARLFPKIVMPGTEAGRLNPELAASTGLGDVKVVAVAGHDTASAVAAVPAADRNFAYLSSGTWSLMGIETDEPVIDEKMFSMNFTNEGGVGGTTRLLKNITGMWLLEQCLAAWRKEGREYSYPEAAEMARSCRPSPAVIDPDAPEFAAPGDMPQAILRHCAEHGIPAPETDAAMIRLIYDSLAARYAEVLGKLREVAPFEISTLHIIGGGSQNDLLNQMTADACGIRVVAGPAEATALGNVMIQAGLGRSAIAAMTGTKQYNPR